MKPHEDTRSEHRFRAGLPARVGFQDRTYECLAHDLSRAGVLLTGRFPWPEVADVRVEVSSAAGDLELRILARVAHVIEDVEAGSIKLGVLFESLDDAAAATLDALVARVVEGTDPSQLERLADDASPEEIRAVLDELPVPHRIQLARRAHVARERQLLRHDSSPQVIEGLARNPHLSTPEIVAIARMRTILPTTIEAIATDPRWRGNEELLVMLAAHPRVTLPVAERIARGLSLAGKRKLLRRPGLNTGVRDRILASAPRGTFEGW